MTLVILQKNMNIVRLFEACFDSSSSCSCSKINCWWNIHIYSIWTSYLLRSLDPLVFGHQTKQFSTRNSDSANLFSIWLRLPSAWYNEINNPNMVCISLTRIIIPRTATDAKNLIMITSSVILTVFNNLFGGHHSFCFDHQIESSRWPNLLVE